MSATTTPAPLVRNAAEAERRWFHGGGVHTWLATAADTAGTFLLFVDEMEQGKVTPLHTHPTDETLYVLEGELLVHLDGSEFPVSAGGLILAPRDVPHAFKVVSPSARVLCLHTPGTCEAFYMSASYPIDDETVSGPVDFESIAASGQRNGGIQLLGPPPFTSD
ncbi:cupin domain-containing protein [Nocardioides sp. InS609-2]|uniref:cupin domain-containing protein n=1 Tax=Nocardioides sp. InS609-2 TaxID=2760705 RepID=UPI0017D51021|nr:cupin domain-containing protein [Nocardioides sp. InS609-2]MBA3780346.1 cupin domain-containing protein [Nocardioides sp.]